MLPVVLAFLGLNRSEAILLAVLSGLLVYVAFFIWVASSRYPVRLILAMGAVTAANLAFAHLLVANLSVGS